MEKIAMNLASPLRYPGGKSRLAPFLGRIIKANRLVDPVYFEPYAGGAGAALSLLFAERVSRIVLNDRDRCVYAFWRAALNQTDRFLELLDSTPLTIREWRRQRQVYLHPRGESLLRLGFATFFLNRCNRSGIIGTGGPIGGLEQRGKWKLDARFNRETLRERIEKVELFRDRIEFHDMDAIHFLRSVVRPIIRRGAAALTYLDPPYYSKARDLYLDSYTHADHATLARFLGRSRFFKWIMTYDNVPEIRALYGKHPQLPFDLDYSLYERRSGSELLIHDPGLTVVSKPP